MSARSPATRSSWTLGLGDGTTDGAIDGTTEADAVAAVDGTALAGAGSDVPHPPPTRASPTIHAAILPSRGIVGGCVTVSISLA